MTCNSGLLFTIEQTNLRSGSKSSTTRTLIGDDALYVIKSELVLTAIVAKMHVCKVGGEKKLQGRLVVRRGSNHGASAELDVRTKTTYSLGRNLVDALCDS